MCHALRRGWGREASTVVVACGHFLSPTAEFPIGQRADRETHVVSEGRHQGGTDDNAVGEVGDLGSLFTRTHTQAHADGDVGDLFDPGDQLRRGPRHHVTRTGHPMVEAA